MDSNSSEIFKSYPFTVKTAAAAEGIFEGYASVYGVVDRDNEVVDRGAFAKTVREAADRVKVYFNHGWMWNEPPIGKALSLADDARGLVIRARIAPTQRGAEALTLAREGVLTELSIGARIVKSHMADDGRRHLKELALHEVSLVDRASNPEARITQVKSARLLAALRDLTPADVEPDALRAAIDALKALLPAEPEPEPGPFAAELAEILHGFTAVTETLSSA